MLGWLRSASERQRAQRKPRACGCVPTGAAPVAGPRSGRALDAGVDAGAFEADAAGGATDADVDGGHGRGARMRHPRVRLGVALLGQRQRGVAREKTGGNQGQNRELPTEPHKRFAG